MADRNELRAISRRSGLFFEGEDCYGFSDKGGHPLVNCDDFWQLLDDCYEAGREEQRREDAEVVRQAWTAGDIETSVSMQLLELIRGKPEAPTCADNKEAFLRFAKEASHRGW